MGSARYSPETTAPRAAAHRRDRAAILTAIAGTTALAWAYLVSMAGMPMGGMHAWTAAHFAMMFAMWAAMMVGMMLPSATPMTLVYAQVVRKAAREGSALPSTAVFVAGYLLAWTGFSLVATAAQWALDRAALLSPMLVAESPRLGAALMVAAGVYQLTPWKGACLRHCRAPAHFFAQHFRPGRLGALRLGLHHGLYCLGCCWALMGLLFVGGVMNLVWIAAIALFVLAEKLIPRGVGGGRLAGAALIALGALLLARG
jgi:predicted metal-binding membrane protein